MFGSTRVARGAPRERGSSRRSPSSTWIRPSARTTSTRALTPGLRGLLAEVLRSFATRALPAGRSRKPPDEPALPGFSSDTAPFLGFSRDSRRRARLRPLVRELPHALRHRDLDEALRRSRLRANRDARPRPRSLRGHARDPAAFPVPLRRARRFTRARDPRDPGAHPSSIGMVAADRAAALEAQIELFEAEAASGTPACVPRAARERTRAGSTASSRSRLARSRAAAPRSDGGAASGGRRPRRAAAPRRSRRSKRPSAGTTARPPRRRSDAWRARSPARATSSSLANWVAEGNAASPAANARDLARAVTRRPSAAVAFALAGLAACGGRDPLARTRDATRDARGPRSDGARTSRPSRGVPHRAGTPAQRAAVERSPNSLRAAASRR